MPVHGGLGTPAQDRNLEEKLLFAKPQSVNKPLRAKRSGLDWKAGEGTPPRLLLCTDEEGEATPEPLH